jgi:hypothetical protein
VRVIVDGRLRGREKKKFNKERRTRCNGKEVQGGDTIEEIDTSAIKAEETRSGTRLGIFNLLTRINIGTRQY